MTKVHQQSRGLGIEQQGMMQVRSERSWGIHLGCVSWGVTGQE